MAGDARLAAARRRPAEPRRRRRRRRRDADAAAAPPTPHCGQCADASRIWWRKAARPAPRGRCTCTCLGSRTRRSRRSPRASGGRSTPRTATSRLSAWATRTTRATRRTTSSSGSRSSRRTSRARSRTTSRGPGTRRARAAVGVAPRRSAAWGSKAFGGGDGGRPVRASAASASSRRTPPPSRGGSSRRADDAQAARPRWRRSRGRSPEWVTSSCSRSSRCGRRWRARRARRDAAFGAAFVRRFRIAGSVRYGHRTGSGRAWTIVETSPFAARPHVEPGRSRIARRVCPLCAAALFLVLDSDDARREARG